MSPGKCMLYFTILLSWGYINGEKKERKKESEVTQLCPTLVIPWTVACQIPLSTGFSGQEYWSGLPFPSPEDLLNPGIEPRSPALHGDSTIFNAGTDVNE